MRDNGTVDRTAVVFCNAANDYAIRSWRLAIIDAAVGHDRELEVGLLGMGKLEVLIVIVGMWVVVTAVSESLARLL